MRSGAGTRCLSVTASSAYGDPYLLRLAAGYGGLSEHAFAA
jgi:hypothetical protein